MNTGISREIEAFAAERQIKYLMHFTKLTNLDAILAKGLLPRNHLENRDGCNDELRLDGTDAVCVSIEFPNYLMFYRLRLQNRDADWIILVIDASVLWQNRSAFCHCNAASNSVTVTPLLERMSLHSFRRMYDDFEEKRRLDLNLHIKLPTHPQAEVLLLDGVPHEKILGVIVERDEIKRRLEAAYPGLFVKVLPNYFQPRSDYKHWKKVIV
ncbi:DarT ssDNA thymidine ADP-ribosyltransferase family protein [Rhodanobacter sp. MP1X3]|uniref:DarT ssDNA thymidine ADP-ribosyltransferase family protein n=1 Tax=Rhodanobacter sp. MP1X3 TaxID=2723086 RepID=UPI0016226FEF|nr:DarT ssDNA thymidine ADP-ribosyltransferase family protein [Rhodanobacter sp. MP1X3]MBB6241267.1 hypothetical protein [Rhodanobacter sp. MP1X3]